jgi:hypothetical protein
VKSAIDARLRREHAVFRLRFSCGDCVHFDPERARCSNEFPVEAHLAAELNGRDELWFCKAFELY